MNGRELLEFSSDLLSAAAKGTEEMKSYINKCSPLAVAVSMTSQYNSQEYSHLLKDALMSIPGVDLKRVVMKVEARSNILSEPLLEDGLSYYEPQAVS